MDETAWGAAGQAPLAAPLGGRFDFDDGGTYLGGWEDGKAHGHGLCTGPKGQGAYAGSWHYGFEVSGLYAWPSGSTYEGQWQNGKRHGLGLEWRGRWLYRGEWTQGFKGRYGVRQSASSAAKYEGTWANGLQDGYGSETYADGGTYQGQWLRGMRHGYGVRTSAPFGMASHGARAARRGSVSSQRSNEPQGEAERDRRLDDSRGGFVLKARSDDVPPRRGSLIEKSSNLKKSIFSGLKMRKPRSTGDLEKKGTSGGSIRSTGSSASWMSTESSHSALTSGSLHTDSNASFLVEDEHLDPSATETYMGEWKNDKRSGFGISERSDGLRYEGEWFNNKKYGYGVTTLRDGTREEGKYKNNLLVTSHKKRHLFLIRSSKFRERIDAAVNAAQRASKIALQKADIAISRTATARGKAEVADIAADQAREDFELARSTALKFAPDFSLPGLDKLRSREMRARQDEVRAQQHTTAATITAPGSSLGPGSLPGSPSRYQTVYDGPASTSFKQPPAQAYPSPPSQQYQTQASPRRPSQPASYQNQQAAAYQQPAYQNQQASYQSQQVGYQNQQNAYPSQQAAYQNQQAAYQNQQAAYQNQQAVYQQQQAAYQQPSSSPYKMADGRPSLAMTSASASSLDDRTTMRRASRQLPSDSPAYNFQQAMSDHFDHYKRPPSRDSSVDRYTRAASRLSATGSRQPSVEKTSHTDAAEPAVGPPQPRSRAPSIGRSPTPTLAGARGSTPTPVRVPAAGNGAAIGAGAASPPPFEELLLRKRGLGQDILPSPVQPKRTESLYVAPQKTPISRPVPVGAKLERKKSLPDVQGVGRAPPAMSREETSALSSARREEVRRNQELSEKYRANPFLYLFSPQVKEWFSRQQLVLFVLFVNISLAIMFFKLLT